VGDLFDSGYAHPLAIDPGADADIQPASIKALFILVCAITLLRKRTWMRLGAKT